MDFEKARELATGEFYLASEALDYGLIDEIGDENTAEDYMRKELNTTEIIIAEYRKKPSFLESLGNVINENFYYMGKGQTSFMNMEGIGIRT